MCSTGHLHGPSYHKPQNFGHMPFVWIPDFHLSDRDAHHIDSFLTELLRHDLMESGEYCCPLIDGNDLESGGIWKMRRSTSPAESRAFRLTDAAFTSYVSMCGELMGHRDGNHSWPICCRHHRRHLFQGRRHHWINLKPLSFTHLEFPALMLRAPPLLCCHIARGNGTAAFAS